MRFGGFQPFTLSDYPGYLAAIVFTQGCNFRCSFCHNSSLLDTAIPDSELLTADAILASLRSRCNKLDGLVVSGGEPTLHTDLPDFLVQVKQLGFKIKLNTNGSYPKRLALLIQENLLDYIAMDVKAPLQDYRRLCGVDVCETTIAESISLIAESGITHHFRTTFVSPLLSATELEHIKSIIPYHSRHITQTFNPYHAFDSNLRQAANFQ
jgi:pyruvate formate lyase activating enzyme